MVWKVFIFVVVFLNVEDEGLMVFNIGFSFYKYKKKKKDFIKYYIIKLFIRKFEKCVKVFLSGIN